MASLIQRFGANFFNRQPVKPTVEQGVAGFRAFGGFVQVDETNSELWGRERWRKATEILANTSIVAASLRFILNLIARPAWRFDPVDDSPAAKEAAEFMDSIIGDMDTSWTRFVRRAGMYRYNGFGAHEWIAKKRDDGRIGIRSLEARPCHTIERWDIDDAGQILGLIQRDPQTSKELYLPREKIMYLVDDALSDRPDGFGWFRHLVEPADRLKTLLDLERLGFERDMRGIPIGRVPFAKLNQMVSDGKITAQQRDVMVSGMEDFVKLQRKSAKTGMVLDSQPYLAKSETGENPSSVMQWGLELLTGDPGSLEELSKAVNRLAYDMSIIMGTEVILTGREGEGSRALSEDKSKNLYLNAQSMLWDIAEAVDRDIRDPVWAMNGLPDELKPKATVEDVAFKDAESIAKTLAELAQAGAILAPDDPAINDLRDLLGIEHASPMDLKMVNALQGRPDPTAPSPEAQLADDRAREQMKQTANDNKTKPTGRAPAAKAAPRTLYVHRNLTPDCAARFTQWAKQQGFATVVPLDDLHVTVAFSRAPLDWMPLGNAAPTVRVPAGGPRVVEGLGPKGAVVMLFRSAELEVRHADILNHGASWDWPSYQPHVTITYQGGDIDLSSVQPFDGDLEFGPEIFSEVVDDWEKSITEKGGGVATRGPFSKYSPDQPRDPAGTATGGQWTSGGYHVGERQPGDNVEVAPVVRQYMTDEQIAELQKLVDDPNATPQEVFERLEPLEHIYDKMTPTIAEGVVPDATFWAERQYADGRNFEQTLGALDAKAASYAGSGGVKQNREAIIQLGPPAAGKSTSADAIAAAGGFAIIDADDAKKFIPEFQGGIGAAAVHEESTLLSGFARQRAMARGDNIILPTVGASQASVLRKVEAFQRAGYKTSVLLVDVSDHVAARRMAGRTLRTGRVIPVDYMRSVDHNPHKTYESLKSSALSGVGFAKISASGPRGSETYVEAKDVPGVQSGDSVFGSK